VLQVAVLGGARCLVSDIKKIPPEAIKVSCNHHAALMLDCDWIVSIEHPRYIMPHLKYIDLPFGDTKGLKVVGYTGTVAVDFAIKRLKADKVYIGGMDLYATDYYWSEEPPKGDKRPISERIDFWKHYRDSLGELAKRVFPISGPLLEVFI